MRVNCGLLLLSLFGVLGAEISRAQETFQEAIPSWPAPAEWSPQETSRGVSTMGAVTSPLPFIGVTPCRVADTRGNGFSGPYGPPSLAANATRTFTIAGQCGIPVSAAAVSFNFGALNVGGTGDLRVFPSGSAVPLASTLNYSASTPNIANAAVVPLGTGGAITVQADAISIDLIIDVNGYYGAGVGTQNTFLGYAAGNFTMTGTSNTGIGNETLFNNQTGSFNTALGSTALLANLSGDDNTATGYSALSNNSGGSYNTATGFEAHAANTTAQHNTAIGYQALFNYSTGSWNTAVGSEALLGSNSNSGGSNVAVGAQALLNNTGGSNIALGTGAGINLTSGGFNMYLGNEGVSSESATIRIGSGLLHNRLFVAGVLSSAVSGTQVLISGTGQLGVASSSARYKEAIRDMGDASDRLSKLRPVTFRYKGHTDEPEQFGLIAEEVEKVLPELVMHSASGQPETVLYHEMPAMLLNEFQKQQGRIDRQAEEIARLLERVRILEGQLSEASPK